MNCGIGLSQTTPEVSPLSGEKAYAHVQRLVSFGPRPPASPGIKKSQAYLTKTLKNLHLDVEHQNFLALTPNGNIPMKNIIARAKKGITNDVIILASHYDTLPMESGVFLGANDGGSSSGLLLELARVLSKQQWNFSFWFVFFDGEEAQKIWSSTDSLYGSRYFVERLKSRRQVSLIKAMILTDMVGDKNLILERDRSSTTWLMDLVWDSAMELGYSNHLAVAPKTIIDDHIPFLKAGIPSVNLIDYEFGKNNRYWHTPQDTIDKISVKSLLIVGEIIIRTIEKIATKN
ncbi:MAG: M28 family peptidase [Acidobacteriia bacterium]|nr:M28 family peptidase [Terriglobia bacterium]